MQTMTHAPSLNWIKEIESSLRDLDEKPQFGFSQSLHWQALEEDLKTILNQPNLKLNHSVKGWLAAHQILEGLGEDLLISSIEWSPLQSRAFFAADQQSIKAFMQELFKTEEAASFFYDSAYSEGFYQYFSLEVLRLLEKQSFASPLSPHVAEYTDAIQKTTGEESCFAIDVSVSIDHKTFWGRVLLPESFRTSWKTYFAHLEPPPLSEELKEKLMVPVGLQIAHSRLSFGEWKGVKAGDFIVLDHCSYDPTEHKGSVVLTLKQKPLFRGRLKDDGIKITNYPIYEEVSNPMDDEFDKDFESEEEDLYEDLDEDEDTESEEDLFADLEPKKEQPKRSSPTAAQLEPQGEIPSISPEDLPIHLTVEVGRLSMTAGALMNLAPGNLLDLHVSPEQGVDLVVNGKKVGRGELIRMGDVLGVRILTL